LPISPADRSRILAFARRAVEHAARTGAADPDPPVDGPFAAPGGLFVTLKRRSDGALRGCIGHLQASGPLGETLAEVARSSALEDPRFPAVRPDEVSGLSVEVSILGEFRATAHPLEELRVGEHGLRIRKGDRGGLLLPQVATEHRMDAAGFLDAVCRKAGLPAGAWRDPGARVELFTAEVFGEG
jgi:AmmeMemoRadiSam system protein A